MYGRWRGVVRGILSKGKRGNNRRKEGREEGNEQSENALLKCQRSVRSSSDAWRLQAQKHKKNNTKQKKLVLVLWNSFLSFPCGCLFTIKLPFGWALVTYKDDLFHHSTFLCRPLCVCMCHYLLYKWMCVCVYTGPAVPLHIPIIGVHWHRHHLHHHPPCWHSPAADAHSQVLLLGHQPAGVQWNHPQRSWYVCSCTQMTHKGMLNVRPNKKRRKCEQIIVTVPLHS